MSTNSQAENRDGAAALEEKGAESPTVADTTQMLSFGSPNRGYSATSPVGTPSADGEHPETPKAMDMIGVDAEEYAARMDRLEAEAATAACITRIDASLDAEAARRAERASVEAANAEREVASAERMAHRNASLDTEAALRAGRARAEAARLEHLKLVAQKSHTSAIDKLKAKASSGDSLENWKPDNEYGSAVDGLAEASTTAAESVPIAGTTSLKPPGPAAPAPERGTAFPLAGLKVSDLPKEARARLALNSRELRRLTRQPPCSLRWQPRRRNSAERKKPCKRS